MSSTAIKISSKLADQARSAAAVSQRSLTGQVEYWASLGSRVEPHFTVSTIHALHKSNGDLSKIEDQTERARILETLEILRNTLPTEFREILKLDQKVIIEPDPNNDGSFIRKHPSGKTEIGTIVNRSFVPN